MNKDDGPIVTLKLYMGKLEKERTPKRFAKINRALKRLIALLGQRGEK